MSDFKAKMYKNPKFGRCSAPDPAGELTALHRPLAGFKGPNSTGVGKGREGMGGSGKGGEGTGVQKIVKIDPGSETVGLRTRPV